MLEKILIERDISLEEYPNLEQVLDNMDVAEKEYLLEILRDFNKGSYQCGSVIHGVYHVEKVFLFTFILSKDIKEPYRRILLDAALYHDIGRRDNAEDTVHGMASANIVENYLDNRPLYQDEKNLIILKSLLYSHCCEDKNDENNFLNLMQEMDLLDDNFELLSDYKDVRDAYIFLLKFLKDADALDRKRFGDISYESLDSNYLRLNSSHNLIELSKEINSLYYELMKADYDVIREDNMTPGECYHSIGFDFFKLNSILNNGILSQDEMKRKHIKIPRNFTGGNFDRWISVVDISLVKENSSAIREFINNGISFYCNGVIMHPPLPHNQRTEALERGLPWDKSHHNDERYVLNVITPDKIQKLIIPEQYSGRDIRSLTYLYNSLEIEIIKARVEHYIKFTHTQISDPIVKELEVDINYYKECIDKYLTESRNDPLKRSLITSYLNDALEKINSNIATMIYRYYVQFFSSDKMDNITVLDIVLFELKRNNQISYKQDTFTGPIEISIFSNKHNINNNERHI